MASSSVGHVVDPLSAHLPEAWRVPTPLVAALARVPGFGGALGFEVRLGQPAPLDVAVHLDARGRAALPAWLDAAPADLATHPAWQRVARACRHLDALGPEAAGVELALEFDAGAVAGDVPVPAVFVVLDEALAHGPTSAGGWYAAVLDGLLPCLRGEAGLPAALRGELEGLLAALPTGAAAAHFGVLLARPVDVVRVCVSGVKPQAAPALLAAAGQPELAELVNQALPGLPELLRHGDPRYLNLDVGPRWLPRVGLELHLDNPVAPGLAGAWAAALATLGAAGAATPADAAGLGAWVGVEAGTWRTLTHLKLEFQAGGAPRPAKAYLKAQPLAAPHAGAPAAARLPTAPPSLLHAGCLARAAAAPEAIALAQGDATWTYAQLVAAAWALAHQLRARGAGPNRLVAVLAAPGPHQAVAVLGVLLAGAAYLPLDAGWPPERVRQLVRLGDPVAVATTPDLAGWLEDPSLALPIQPREPGEPGSWPAATPEDLAYVIFTSGTTGSPKGVMIPHRAAANTVLDINQRFAVGPADRVLAISSLAFDLSVYDLFGTWAAGARLVYAEPGAGSYAARMLAAARAGGVTVWNSVPSTLQLALAGDGEAPTLRLVMLSGDWVPPALPPRAWARLPGAEVVSLGGSTEGAIWSILHPIGPADVERPSIPYGAPASMRGQEILVLDEALRPCPVGMPGELYIAGEGVAAGYWRDEARTAERFVLDPATGERLFRTGDHGTLGPDGLIVFQGRQDAQVKIQGYRVDLTEVEQVLAGLPGVAAVAVTPCRPAEGEPFLGAAFVLAPDATDRTIGEVLVAAHGCLPAYMVPGEGACLALGALPLTANGKVDRRAVAEQILGTPQASEAPSALAGMLAIWREVLGVPTIGPDDDFYAQGGSSLAAVQIAWQVRARLGATLPLVAVLEGATPAQLVDRWLARGAAARADQPRALAEALPAEITPAAASYPASLRPATYLLTGATGYVGIHLLDALLARPEAVVHCLVRAAGAAAGLARLERIAATYGLAPDWHRVVAVPGDVALPRLGLDEASWERLALEVEAIVHSAASVSFGQPYDKLREPNVVGTQEVLRLAASGRLKPVHAVSSLSAAVPDAPAGEAIRETDPPAVPPGLLGGLDEGAYPLTKWAAERLLVQARERGLPVAIYRPGFVFGHARTGASNGLEGFIGTLMAVCLELGAYPDVAWGLPIVGVDEVARAVAALVDDPGTLGGVYHLLASPLPGMADFAAAAAHQGYELEPLGYAAWRHRLAHRARTRDAARPLVAMLGDRLEAPPPISTARTEARVGPLAAPTRAGIARAIAWLQATGAVADAGPPAPLERLVPAASQDTPVGSP